MKIAISLSESSDYQKFGFDLMHIDRAAIEISRYLLIAGVVLFYGGHLGDEGYTLSLFNIVQAHPEKQGEKPLERIINYIGWPLPLSVEQRSKFKNMVKFIKTPRPKDLSEKDAPEFVENIKKFFPAEKSGIHRFAWARGMTLMREKQTKKIDARIVMGGKFGPTITALPGGGRKVKWYYSRIPGVLEEILITIDEKKPVYLIGGFGGCARLAADLICKKEIPTEMSWEYQKDAPHAPEMKELYISRKVPWRSYEDMIKFLKGVKIKGLNNGLSITENKELFVTSNIDRIVELLLKGLSKKS